MQASDNGNPSDFQSENAGSIPAACSIKDRTMNKEQKEKHDALLEALAVKESLSRGEIDATMKSLKFFDKHEKSATEIIRESAQAYADIYPSLCAFDAAGDKATNGDWEYLDWKQQNERGLKGGYSHHDTLAAFVSNKTIIMDFGDMTTYYPTEGEQPHDDHANFITIAANIRAKIKGGLV